MYLFYYFVHTCQVLVDVYIIVITITLTIIIYYFLCIIVFSLSWLTI